MWHHIFMITRFCCLLVRQLMSISFQLFMEQSKLAGGRLIELLKISGIEKILGPCVSLLCNIHCSLIIFPFFFVVKKRSAPCKLCNHFINLYPWKEDENGFIRTCQSVAHEQSFTRWFQLLNYGPGSCDPSRR